MANSTTNTAPGSPRMKKGRHRRFEEARKLKQSGPAAFGGFGPREVGETRPADDDDDYTAIAERYGAFDDDADDVDEPDDEPAE
jgi:hypothetical protein